MFSKLSNIIRNHISYMTVLTTIIVGLIALIFDGKRYRRKGLIKELKVVRIISYSYIALGGIMFLLLLIT